MQKPRNKWNGEKWTWTDVNHVFAKVAASAKAPLVLNCMTNWIKLYYKLGFSFEFNGC